MFGPKYSDFDREVQKHKGFVAPKPKPKEKKKAPPALAESGEPPKKRRRLPDIWMAVPLVENTVTVRRVNKYTASKMAGSGERNVRFERKAKKEGMAKAEQQLQQLNGGRQMKKEKGGTETGMVTGTVRGTGSKGKGGEEEEHICSRNKRRGETNKRRSPRTGECDV